MSAEDNRYKECRNNDNTIINGSTRGKMRNKTIQKEIPDEKFDYY